jgi:hypothetical protein
MPTRKVAAPEPQEVCLSPEHDVPTSRCFTPGVWEHECPSCGQKYRFTVCGQV